MLTVPKEIEGLHIVASFSGGKDSTALLIALQASGLPFTAVFADTGWEHPLTLEYVDYVADKLGIVVHKVGVPGGMVARAQTRAGFPTRMARWCTGELKVNPIRDFTRGLRASVGDTAGCVGVRADESAKRAGLAELDDDADGKQGWDGYVWRPLLRWDVLDVLTVIAKAGLKVNPLYQMGLDRVGCFPCIFASKAEVQTMASIWPERVAEIEALETEFTALRAERNEVKPGRYTHDRATFFQSRRPDMQPQGIRELVEWSHTARGGKQFDLFPGARGGCMSWGLCDMPAEAKVPE
jgi:3'-phosphoadenosine 5'-phosphosulfate sulfotransferase (PAPS reductase)/FAD synthetase